MILALCFAYIDELHAADGGAVRRLPGAVVLHLGFVAHRSRNLSWGAAALILLSPLIPALAPTVAAWIFHARLALAASALSRRSSVAADVFTHDKLRLFTGHGFATVSHGVRDRILPAADPDARSPSRSGMSLGSSAQSWRRTGAWFAFRVH